MTKAKPMPQFYRIFPVKPEKYVSANKELYKDTTPPQGPSKRLLPIKIKQCVSSGRES